jgi:PAS domain S-box-containing protein
MGQEIDLGIVGQIVSAINVLHIFPSEEKAGEFLVALLTGVPGCSSASLCLRRTANPIGGISRKQCCDCSRRREQLADVDDYLCELANNDNLPAYPLETTIRLYGYLILRVENVEEYEQYESFIRDIGNVYALILENRWQQEALQESKDFLEQRVMERTSELQQTNALLQVDIAERKQAENALVESEEHFRVMFERHLAVKLVLNPETGDIVDANEAAAKFYGWSVEQLKQMRIQQINTLPAEKLIIELEKAKSQAQISFEFRHRIADGSIRDVEVFSNRIDISGKSFLYSIIHDITDRKEAQQALAHIAERDRHISEIFQQTAMPRCIPTLPECYEIATKYQPALQEADVCGDFYDIFELDDGNIGITIGDIIGKGLPAALRITAARNMIRSYAFLYDSPAKVMALVNDALCKDIAMESDMLTAFYAVLDTRNHTLTYSNAGHEPPLMRYSNGNIEPLELCGPMFYGMGKQIYSEVHIDFQENDVLVMVTDGISEASIDRSSDLFGAEGIIRCLSTNATSSTEQIATAILEDATYFANGILHDDASIVVIKKISDQ